MENSIKYLEAKRRVKQLRKFYIHVAIYIGFNLISFLGHWDKEGDTIKVYDGFNLNFSYLWGIVVIIHAISVFLPSIRSWERNKIQELMNKNNQFRNGKQ